MLLFNSKKLNHIKIAKDFIFSKDLEHSTIKTSHAANNNAEQEVGANSLLVLR